MEIFENHVSDVSQRTPLSENLMLRLRPKSIACHPVVRVGSSDGTRSYLGNYCLFFLI